MAGELGPTRRDAVKTAAAAAAAVASAHPAPALRRDNLAKSAVLYGVVGAGERGVSLLRSMARLAGGRCVAVCDVDGQNLSNGLAAAGAGAAGHQDYRELLARKDVEAVVVATPPYTHFSIVRDALEAGKHVFCESTLVFQPEELHALRALVGPTSDRVLQVGLQRRYSAYYRAAWTMVAKGLIGNVTHIITQWHRNPGWQMRPYASRPKESNWRLYREYSGGLAAELMAHQVDVAGWMFGAQPEFVTGVGGREFAGDGRDIYDNIQLIYKYPRGQKLIATAISTNQHLPLFGETRTEAGERIMGTGGTIEITAGTGAEPGIALWYCEPRRAQAAKVTVGRYEEGTIATATLGSFGYGTRGYPILLAPDQMRGDESFLEKEAKYFRRWLYAKGVMVPNEERNPEEAQMESFFECCRTGVRPKADLRVGLASSTAVMLSNLAMEEGRRVFFSEMDKMGRRDAPAAPQPRRTENGNAHSPLRSSAAGRL